MNVQSKPFKLDWKKIGIIAVVLAVAGYQWYIKNNPPQPALADGGGQATAKHSADEYEVNFPGTEDSSSEKKLGLKMPDFGKSNSSKSNSNKGNASESSAANSGSYLSGGRTKSSPEGLKYTMGSGGEHRTEHVLRHAVDMPNRPTHSVFNVQGDDVFRLIDEAYALVKSKSSRVKAEPKDDRGITAYVIDMKRQTGYKGGQSGKRKKHPKLNKVKLILADNRVITAYPY